MISWAGFGEESAGGVLDGVGGGVAQFLEGDADGEHALAGRAGPGSA